MNVIKIQVQDFNMNWFTAQTEPYTNDQVTRQRMEQVSRNWPGKRVRAIDNSGNLIDIL